MMHLPSSARLVGHGIGFGSGQSEGSGNGGIVVMACVLYDAGVARRGSQEGHHSDLRARVFHPHTTLGEINRASSASSSVTSGSTLATQWYGLSRPSFTMSWTVTIASLPLSVAVSKLRTL